MRIVIAPLATAALKAAAVAACGTSSWPSTTSTRSSVSIAAAASSGVSASFAPAITMMRFVPSGSTQIGATPLDPGTRARCRVSTPWASKLTRVISP